MIKILLNIIAYSIGNKFDNIQTFLYTKGINKE